MPIRTCLFDLGDVLIRFSHERMCRQMGDLTGHSVEETRVRLLDSGLQWEFERGHLTEAEFLAAWEESTGVRGIDPDALARASGDIFTPMPGIDELIDDLTAAGLRLVILSNTCITHIRWVREHFPVYSRFDDYVLSYEVGSAKPEPTIYEAALAAIDCDPSECLYTDDRPENIEAAQPFGLDAVPFTDVAALRSALDERSILPAA